MKPVKLSYKFNLSAIVDSIGRLYVCFSLWGRYNGMTFTSGYSVSTSLSACQLVSQLRRQYNQKLITVTHVNRPYLMEILLLICKLNGQYIHSSQTAGNARTSPTYIIQ